MANTLCPIYYDTETTGVRIDKDKIIELAAYDPVNDRTFCKFINPGCPIPKEATAIHHISDEMVESAADFKTVMQEFLQFCPTNAVLIAHNNDAFDKPFIHSECERAGLVMPSFAYIDTLKWSRRYRSDLPKHSLQFLRQVYGLSANQAHRALDDVIILHQVFSLMIDDLPIDTVVQLLAKPQTVSKMPFGKHQGKMLNEVPKNYLTWLMESGALDKAENQELKEAIAELVAK